MITRRISTIPALDIAEIDDIPFDYTKDLRAGETIISPVVTVLKEDGTEQPEAKVGSATIGRLSAGVFTADVTGPVVIQRIQGVALGTYTLRCVAPLSSGRKLTAAADLPVVKL